MLLIVQVLVFIYFFSLMWWLNFRYIMCMFAYFHNCQNNSIISCSHGVYLYHFHYTRKFLSCPRSWYIIYISFYNQNLVALKKVIFIGLSSTYVFYFLFWLGFSIFSCVISSTLPSKGEGTLSTRRWVLLPLISHFHIKYNNNLMHVVLNQMFM